MNTDLIGSQWDTPPTAGTEAALTVAAGSAAAISKLGLMADTTSRRLGPRCLSRRRLFPQLLHLVFIHLKLLMQLPVRRGERSDSGLTVT